MPLSKVYFSEDAINRLIQRRAGKAQPAAMLPDARRALEPRPTVAVAEVRDIAGEVIDQPQAPVEVGRGDERGAASNTPRSALIDIRDGFAKLAAADFIIVKLRDRGNHNGKTLTILSQHIDESRRALIRLQDAFSFSH